MSLLSQLASQVGDRSQAANRQVAAQCIAQPKHLQEIVVGLQSTDAALLGDCLEVLCKVAESQPPAVVPYAPALPALLTHTTTRVRWETAHTLALLAPHVPETISSLLPALAQQLHTEASTIVRDYSIDTLSAYATTATAAAQAVLPLLEAALTLWEGKHAGRILQGLLLIARAVPGATAQICPIAAGFSDDPRSAVRKAARAILKRCDRPAAPCQPS
jgi:hypothetical protein